MDNILTPREAFAEFRDGYNRIKNQLMEQGICLDKHNTSTSNAEYKECIRLYKKLTGKYLPIVIKNNKCLTK